MHILSMSPGEKSSRPSALRYGGAVSLTFLDLYGLATGRLIILSSFSIFSDL
jgi:hypothetical protein